MKNWLKILTLSFVCALTTLVFVACESSVSATSVDDNTSVEEPVSNNQQQSTEVVVTPTPCQHDFENWEVVEPSTCTKHGTEKRHCKNCDYSETRSIETLADHSFDHENGEVTKAPTCCETGIYTYYCTECHQARTEILPIDPNNHTDLVEETVASTCTKKGYHGERCQHCGELINKTDNELLAEHDYDSATHQCKNCPQYQSPIENLADSVWYLQSTKEKEIVTSYTFDETPWLIRFKTVDECYTFKYKDDNGTRVEDKVGRLYPGKKGSTDGKYELLKHSDGNYYIKFTGDNSHDGDIKYIGLLYETTTVEGEVRYTLTNTGKLFNYDYEYCVLIFAGYGVQ